jgi:hypothetical protein
MIYPTRRTLLRGAAALLIVTSAPALAQSNQKDQAMTSLFKIISVKDEIVIGLNPDELSAMGGSDAGAVAKALHQKGTLSVWQYSTRKADNGDLEQAPAPGSA